MAIRLISAPPRSGKSLFTMELIEGYFSKGRMVYVDGIEVVDRDRFPVATIEGGFPNWQSCVPGSVIVVDEAHRYLRGDKLPRVLPDWIDKLATHSHAGMDFDIIMISQAPGHLHPFVRTLVTYHQHLMRKNGAEAAYMFSWDGEMCQSPHLPAQRKRAERTKWDFPNSLYGSYVSAGVHQVEKKKPAWVGKVVKGVIFMAAMIALAVYAIGKVGPSKGDAKAEAKPVSMDKPAETSLFSSLSSPTSKQSVQKPMTADEYAKQFVPRIAARPWSAPAYDGQKPTSMPMLYCISAEVVGCKCYTEQATSYSGVPDDQCKKIALEGLYNPYKVPEDQRVREQKAQPGQSFPPSVAVAQRAGPAVAEGGYVRGVGTAVYTPPEQTVVGAIGD